MSGPYRFQQESTKSPLDRQPQNLFPAGQPPSFKTNVNRMKTKKWVEAKKNAYDGDDWGEYDEYDEYGVVPPLQQPTVPIGFQNQGQRIDQLSRSSTDLQRQGLPESERRNSFEAGDEHRSFSAAAPPPQNEPFSDAPPSNPSKPLPFIRPADIYKRVEEERQRERASLDSSPPSLILTPQQPTVPTGFQNPDQRVDQLSRSFTDPQPECRNSFEAGDEHRSFFVAAPSSQNFLPTDQLPSFKTNVNRMKTKKWVEARKNAYDGDDWGEYDEYDEYGLDTPPQQPTVPTGIQNQGQRVDQLSASSTDLQRQGLPQPEHRNSFEAGNEHRSFSITTHPLQSEPSSDAPPQQSHSPQIEPSYRDSLFHEGDQFYVKITRLGTTYKRLLQVAKVRLHSSKDFYEYQLLDKDGTAYDDGQWIREQNIEWEDSRYFTHSEMQSEETHSPDALDALNPKENISPATKEDVHFSEGPKAPKISEIPPGVYKIHVPSDHPECCEKHPKYGLINIPSPSAEDLAVNCDSCGEKWYRVQRRDLVLRSVLLETGFAEVELITGSLEDRLATPVLTINSAPAASPAPSVLTTAPENAPQIVPFSDSGYASATHKTTTQARQLDDLGLSVDTNSAVNQTSSIQASALGEDLDEKVSIYSAESALTQSGREIYTAELAEDILEHIYGYGFLVQRSLDRVLTALPDLLKAFAMRVGHCGESQESKDVMVFINRYRGSITEALKIQVMHRQGKSINIGQSSHEMMQNWLRRQEKEGRVMNSYQYVGENMRLSIERQDNEYKAMDSQQSIDEKMREWRLRQEAEDGIPDEVFVGVSDQLDDNVDDDLHARLPNYRDFVTNNPAYEWLLATLHRELTWTTPNPNHMRAISKSIVGRLSQEASFRTFSRNRRPHVCNMQYTLQWDPIRFMKEQEYESQISLDDVLERAITLTGKVQEAQACTASQYLEQTWPHLGKVVLSVLQHAMHEHQRPFCEHSYTLQDNTSLHASTSNGKFRVTVRGTLHSVAEVGEVLAWIGAALRSSPKDNGVVYSVPFIQDLDVGSRESDCTSVFCTIGFKIELDLGTDEFPESNGTCWYNLFRNPIIVKGYPIRYRHLGDSGVEMPIEMMASLIGSRKLTDFAGNAVIKSFSAMLLLTERLAGAAVAMWHLLFNEDGDHISFADPRVHKIIAPHSKSADFAELETSRHIVGWCSKVQSFTGGPSANYSINWSGLPKPHKGCAFEKITISGGKYISAGISCAIGKKDKPVHFKAREDYMTQLKWLEKKFVVLYDLVDRRGWLVDGVSALLHLVRASLRNDIHDSFRHLFLFKQENLKEADSACTGKAAAIAVLTNTLNQNLKLYQKPEDIYEEETVQKEGNSEKVDKTKRSFFCLKDRVDQIYHLLEQIIAHQSQVNSEDGVGFRMKYTPRRQLEGFDFMDIASDEDPFWPRVTTLRATGAGWVDFARALHAITLFGEGFGELIKAHDESQLCSSWSEVPKGMDFLAVCNSDLGEILRKRGNNRGTIWRLVDDIYWHQPGQSFALCQCAETKSSKICCDRVQVLLPARFPRLWSRKFCSPPELPSSGAVIFGHSWKFPLRWGDHGEPEEGEPAEDSLSDSFNDSALGSSLSPPSNSIISGSESSQREMPSVANKKNKKGMKTLLEHFRKRRSVE